MPIVEIEDRRKTFPGGTVAIDGISLELDEGEVVTFLGSSGCGKTTTLRCVAGLETPDSGQVRINGRPMFRPSRSGMRGVPPEERGLSMVFQQYALWPHMNVLENVSYGLVVRKRPKSEVASAAERALKLVKLWELRHRRISQLSGGQQQRIAFARALAFDPSIVLLDEPLSNLDAKLREEMRLEFIELQRRLGFAAIYVTHDQHEAIGLSDRIVIMNNGRIEQIGVPREVWTHPATPFVTEFIGEANRIDGVLEAGDAGDSVRLRTDQGPLVNVEVDRTHRAGARVVGYVAYSKIGIRDQQTDELAMRQSHTVIDGKLVLASFQGHSTLIKVSFGSGSLAARTGPDLPFAEGDDVRIVIPVHAIRCFPAGEVSDADSAQLAEHAREPVS